MLMNVIRIAAASVALAGGVAVPAQADFSLDGWVEFNNENGTNAGTFFAVRRNLAFTFSEGDFTMGIGQYESHYWDYSTSTWFRAGRDPYLLVSFDNVTLTFGEFYGAGNIFPEDYFGYNDTTSTSDMTGRLDVTRGDHHFAYSYDFDGGPGDYEIGYAGQFGKTHVSLGWENDDQQLGVLIGRPLGGVNVQLAVLNDVDSAGRRDQAGLTLEKMFNNGLRVAVNYAHGTNPGIGTHSYGAIASYTWNDATFMAKYVNRPAYGTRYQVELGLIVPIGKRQPADRARSNFKEYRPGFW